MYLDGEILMYLIVINSVLFPPIYMCIYGHFPYPSLLRRLMEMLLRVLSFLALNMLLHVHAQTGMHIFSHISNDFTLFLICMLVSLQEKWETMTFFKRQKGNR